MEPSSPPLSELTLKAILLGIVLSIILAAANAYLGLYAGMTVSASIPAAVVSMAVLRLFRRATILENNIVQTAASAGESLAAGVVFTFPALLVLGHWKELSLSEHYGTITSAAAVGGVLGVMFTIPLRRALIAEARLKFPEGVATAEVLRAGEGGRGAKRLVAGAVGGGGFKLLAEGLGLLAGKVAWSRWLVPRNAAGGGVPFYAGATLSPALLAVGYIVGLPIAILVFSGGVIGRWIALPIIGLSTPDLPADPAAAIEYLHGERVKYIGVGAMVVGGVAALISLAVPVARGLRRSFQLGRRALREIPRTERDTPFLLVVSVIAACAIPILLLYRATVGVPGVGAAMTAVMLVAGFLFSAVAAYMGGLVGSSNNPISGVTIATVLLASLLLAALLGPGAVAGPAAAILVGAVVCCAASIAGDNMQDLKTGYLVGATPCKQQIAQVVGTLAAAFVLMPVLWLLSMRYGIVTPARPGVDALPAPQAGLMAGVARGVFQRDLPWDMIAAGECIALAVIALDLFLRARTRFRAPVLAVAVGIYLPFDLTVAIFLGGWIAHLARGRREEGGEDRGLLFACGLITGEALLGILLALPIVAQRFVWAGFPAEFRVPLPPGAEPLAEGAAVAALVAFAWALVRLAGRDRARGT